MSLTTDKQERKNIPIGTGVLDYFPDALAEIAKVSKVGNDQHNPGQPLHWAKEKSTDESDAMIRHYLERYDTDIDGTLHAAKMAWRALAFLQRLCDERKRPTTTYEQRELHEDFGYCIHDPAGLMPQGWCKLCKYSKVKDKA